MWPWLRPGEPSGGAGVPRGRGGRVYRGLRWLEASGLAAPSWDTDNRGPARRIYQMTPEGGQLLDVLRGRLRCVLQNDGTELSLAMVSRLNEPVPTPLPFTFTVTGRFRVSASDDSAARRKIQALFGRPHIIADDIATTGIHRVRPTHAP